MPHPASKTIGFQLSLAARAHRSRLGQRLEQLGLFPGQERIVDYLSTHASASIGDLSRALGVKPPTVSKSVNRLAAENLVERVASTGDSRVVIVQLTESGAALAERLDHLLSEVETEIVSLLGEKESRKLRKTLRRLARALEGDVNEGNDVADETDSVEELV